MKKRYISYAIFFLSLFFLSNGMLLSKSVQMEMHELPNKLKEKTTALNHKYLFSIAETASIKEKIPLVIFLHGGGGGGEGDDILKFKKFGPAQAFKKIEEPIALLIPQALKRSKNGGRATWQSKDLNFLLEHILDTVEHIDTNRIYLTGTSMGGYGTWMWAAANPEYFAAIIPVCGGLGEKGPKDITKNLDQWKNQLVNVPIWAFHGEKDNIVPADRTIDMITSVQEKGSDVAKMTIFPNKGHNITGSVYHTKGLLDWMLSQSK
jgi:predicted peptidase